MYEISTPNGLGLYKLWTSTLYDHVCLFNSGCINNKQVHYVTLYQFSLCLCKCLKYVWCCIELVAIEVKKGQSKIDFDFFLFSYFPVFFKHFDVHDKGFDGYNA